MPDICWNCGRPVPPERRVCECGASPRGDWFSSRETILLVTFLVLVGAFAVTALAARFYHDRRRGLAEFWFGQGTADLSRGKASSALSDLQTALIYARQDVSETRQQAFSLNLARALVANHRLEEAYSYLLDLWQETPDSATLNLELAHLSVAMGNDAEAQRYYANAIYGIWQGSPDQVRQNQREAQLEFCRYLIDRGEKTAAQSVLLAVAASLPQDPALHLQVGGMMLEAGTAAQALEEYQQVLEADRRNHEALIGAGLSSFDLGNDREAVRYLGQASAQKPALPPDAARDLSVASADLSLDFFDPGVGVSERAHRAARAFEVVKTRIGDCAKSLGVSLPAPAPARAPSALAEPASGTPNLQPATDDLAVAYDAAMKMQTSMRGARLDRDPQLLDSLRKLVFQMDSAATAHCGASTEIDEEALARIAARYRGQDHE